MQYYETIQFQFIIQTGTQYLMSELCFNYVTRQHRRGGVLHTSRHVWPTIYVYLPQDNEKMISRFTMGYKLCNK